MIENVAVHGSRFDGVKGADRLRGLTIGSDQVIDIAHLIFPASGIVIDDEYLDEMPDRATE
jgi:hypothetical protein